MPFNGFFIFLALASMYVVCLLFSVYVFLFLLVRIVFSPLQGGSSRLELKPGRGATLATPPAPPAGEAP